jgi:hypothetical protein
MHTARWVSSSNEEINPYNAKEEREFNLSTLPGSRKWQWWEIEL